TDDPRIGLSDDLPAVRVPDLQAHLGARCEHIHVHPNRTVIPIVKAIDVDRDAVGRPAITHVQPTVVRTATGHAAIDIVACHAVAAASSLPAGPWGGALEAVPELRDPSVRRSKCRQHDHRYRYN